MNTQTEINNSELKILNSELPAGWRWVKLDEVCEYESGVWGEEPDGSTDCHFVLRSNNIKDGKMIFDEIAIRKVEHRYVASKSLKLGDVLVTTSSGSKDLLGKSAIFIPPDDKIYLFSNFTMRLRGKPIVDSFYLYFYLQSSEAKNVLQLIQDTTTGLRNLDRKEFLNQLFPLPSLEEQKRITAKLQELMQEVERAKTAVEKQLESANALPSTYLREVFESESAKKWEKKKKFQECVVKRQQIIIKGIPQKNYKKEGTYPIIDQGQQVVCGYTDDLSKVYQGELPVIIFGDHTRIFKYIDFPFAIGADGTKTIIPNKNEVNPMFFYFALLNLNLRSLGYSRHYKLLREVVIPLPPFKVQHRIATDLKEKMAQVENLQSAILNQQSALDALPQTILKKAFKGEL